MSSPHSWFTISCIFQCSILPCSFIYPIPYSIFFISFFFQPFNFGLMHIASTDRLFSLSLNSPIFIKHSISTVLQLYVWVHVILNYKINYLINTSNDENITIFLKVNIIIIIYKNFILRCTFKFIWTFFIVKFIKKKMST